MIHPIKWLLFLFLGLAFNLHADDSPFAKGKWNASPFASYRVNEIGAHNGKLGGGLAVGYAPADNVAIEVETLSEGYHGSPVTSSLDEAGVNFKGYLPLKDTGLAPYGFIGYTRNLRVDDNRMNAGAGLEYRATEIVGLFADGRWTHNFEQSGHALFRLGASIRF